MTMTEDQWVDLGAWLAACFPGHTIGDATWEAWYEELRGFSQAEIRDALRRCIREVPKLPTVANIYRAIDANHKQEREERERFESLRRQRDAEGKQGVPAPPEFKKALRLAVDPTSRTDGKIRPDVLEEIYDLGQKIMDRGPEWVPDDERDEYLASVTRLPARDPSGAWS